MGAWSLYFLAKLGLHWNQTLQLHWWPNLLFAIVLAWPLAATRWRRLRHVVAVPVAIALLYHDSYLPPPSRLFSQASVVSSFSADYLLELAQRVVSWPLLAALAALVIAYLLLARRLRFASFAFLGLLLVPLLPAGGFWSRAPALAIAPDGAAVQATPTGPLRLDQLEDTLTRFYAGERGKTVAFPAATPPAFDLVLLSVCSLSWDDLDLLGLRQAPLLGKLDIVFRQFNAAASYSGPSVLRLLHANCGQSPQNALYEPVPDQCYLFRSLAAAGYQPALLMNHDGHFDNFAQQLQTQGGMGVAPLPLRGAPEAMQAFDGTPIYSDFEVLSQWWRSQQAAPGGPHQALLYNTISLHDGNRVPGFKSQRSTDTYRPRVTRLFADLERFIDLVQASGRPTVIALVPEHGGALRGDAVQISGLREIPTPAITHVPVGVKLVNFPGVSTGASPLVVDKPSSHLALAALIAQLMNAGASLQGRDALEAIVRDLPGTDWVAENDGTVLLRRDGRSWLRASDGQWTEFAAGR